MNDNNVRAVVAVVMGFILIVVVVGLKRMVDVHNQTAEACQNKCGIVRSSVMSSADAVYVICACKTEKGWRIAE